LNKVKKIERRDLQIKQKLASYSYNWILYHLQGECLSQCHKTFFMFALSYSEPSPEIHFSTFCRNQRDGDG